MSGRTILNESTSVIHVDTRGLQGGNYSLIYVSTTTIPGQVVTVFDQTGNVSSPQAILLSTVGSARLAGGAVAGTSATSTLIRQRFGYVTLASDADGGSTWNVVGESPFPDPAADVSYKAVDSESITISSLNARGHTSTSGLVTRSIDATNTFEHTNFYASTLYVNSLSRFQAAAPTDPRATVSGHTHIYESVDSTRSYFSRGIVSTGGDFFARGNVSTKTGTYSVGSNINILGSLRSPRALLSVQSSLAVTGGGGTIRGTALFQEGFTVGDVLAAAGTVSTPVARGLTAAVSSSLLFQGGVSIQGSGPTLRITAGAVTVPSSVSTNYMTVTNTTQAPSVSASAFGPSTQTLAALTLSSTQIQNAAGSLAISSITGGTALTLTNVEALRVAVGGNTSLAGGINMSAEPTDAGVALAYPPGGAPFGLSNFSTSWLITAAPGSRARLLAPAASMSTNFTTASYVETGSLQTVNEALVNVQALGVTASNALIVNGATLSLLGGTPIVNTGGALRGTISTFAETATASTIFTSQIRTTGAAATFVGQTTAAFSTVQTSSLSSRSITTSSFSFTGGIVGNPALYSTINPSTTWLLPSTFQMNGANPFVRTTGLGTYFYDVKHTAASNATAYYSIIDPTSRIPMYLSTPYINTVAGTGTAGYTGDGGAATAARIGTVIGQPAVGSDDSVYFGTNTVGWSLRRVASATQGGTISTVTGNYQYFYGDNGPLADVAFGPRLAVSIPSPGYVLVTDISNVRLRQTYYDDLFNPLLTTVAGTGVSGYSGDGGLAAAATFSNPIATAATQNASTLYVVDSGNNMIRGITASTITRVAGTGTAGGTGDGGAATAARLRAPFGAAVAANDDLYITDLGNSVVRVITAATNTINLVAGNYTAGFSGDGGAATAAQLSSPRGIALDGDSNVIVADTGNARLRRVTAATGLINTIAGNGISAYGGDGGPPASASFSTITGVAADTVGNLYVADTDNHCIRYVNLSTNTVQTVAGIPTQGGYNGDGSFATYALLSNPSHVAFDRSSGYVYFADDGNKRIRYIDPTTGIIFTYAGNGSPATAGDGGPARKGVFQSMNSAAAVGDLVYVADALANRIRSVNLATNLLATVVGTGLAGFGGDDGPATAALVSSPTTVAVDPAGTALYFTDTENQRVRRVDTTTGIITTVAGNGTAGYSGDGDAAVAASLNYPRALGIDRSGTILYVGDSSNYRVRRVNLSEGIIDTVAGTGTPGSPLAGVPANASPISAVPAVTVAPDAAVHLVDTSTNAIWRINPNDGTFELQSAASTIGSYLGDAAPLSNAYVNAPTGLFCDAAGNFLVADNGNKRIRRTYTYGNSNFPRYANLVFSFTNYFTTQGYAYINLNGHRLATFDAAAGSNLSFSLRNSNIWDYPLLSSNPVLGDQTPWIEVTTQSNTGYVKLDGLAWMDMYPGQEGDANTVDSNAGFVMNRGRLIFPFRNNGITIDNEFNDASTRSLAYTGSLNAASDPALKEDIQAANLRVCYDTLAALPLRNYRYNAAYTSTFHIDAGARLGLLTTEVAPHFPHSILPVEAPCAGIGTTHFQTLDITQVKAAHLGATQQLICQVSTLEGQLGALEMRKAHRRGK